MSNFHPIEAVARASEKEIQVGDNLNDIKDKVKGRSVVPLTI